jgi:hypothetical protein
VATADKYFISYRLNFIDIISVSGANKGPAINFISDRLNFIHICFWR